MKLLRTIAAGMLSIVATTVLIAADYTVAGQFITIPVQQPQSDGAKIVRLQVVTDNIIRVQATSESQLPEKQRSCMQLRDIEGKSYKDIATILNITEEQVKINIFRARQTIREQFKKADT